MSSAYPNTPKVVYNSTTLLFTRPARPWIPGTQGVGAGRAESAAGVPSVWVTRRDRLLSVPLRFTESEWPSVRAWLVWAMDGGGSFAFYPDQNEATSYTVYLVSPSIADEVAPSRGEHFGEMELTVKIRTTAGTAIEPAYY